MTKTVFGFDEFVTTVGSTVMVFLPSADLPSVSSSSSSSSISPTSQIASHPVESSSVFVSPENLPEFDSSEDNKLPLENMFRLRSSIL